MKVYQKHAMLSKLDEYIFSNYKSAAQYAKDKGVSSAFVSAVRKGNKNPSKEMLEDLGMTMHKVNDVIFCKA